MRTRIKMFGKMLLTVIMLLICSIAYVSYDIYAYGDVDEAQGADAAIVLGAAVWSGRPSPVFKERINHGIWLYKKGYVDKLILTGGRLENDSRSDAEVARKYAIENGVPPQDILLEERSRVTFENLLYAAKVMEANDLSTALVVSDPLHMRRAMRMAEELNLDAHPSPTPSTKYRSLRTKSLFLTKETLYYIGYQFYLVLSAFSPGGRA